MPSRSADEEASTCFMVGTLVGFGDRMNPPCCMSPAIAGDRTMDEKETGPPNSGVSSRPLWQQKRGIAIGKEPVAFGHGVIVHLAHPIPPHKGGDQHQQRAFGQVEIGH